MKHLTISALCIMTLATGCGNKPQEQKLSQAYQEKTVTVPSFSADTAYQHIERQIQFGPRVPGTSAQTRCADYLSAELTRYGASVTVQDATVETFDNQILPCKNIIGAFQPKKSNRIMLCSHWDSRPFADHDKNKSLRDTPIDGANDGASGVGILLEIARQLGKQNTNLGVDIIFFDAEDYGTPDHRPIKQYKEDSWCLGTQYWGRTPHVNDYEARFGILLDMVGAPDAQFYIEQYSAHTAHDVVEKVWNTAETLGYAATFVRARGGSITDDHVYVNKLRNIPCIDIIQYDPNTETGFGSYWHTHNDNLENISLKTLNAVGQTVLYVVYNEK